MVANLLGQTVRLQRLIASDRERLMGEQRRLEKTLEHAVPPSRAQPLAGGIVGNAPTIRAVLEKVRRVAGSQSTVLLRGESGTGKELFARAVHEFSSRSKGPFVAVNCAALAESVLESELFGHEKGAFTGAVSQRKGRFEQANGGTLFLDEIGEISPGFQAKLLRVLQLGEFERVGGNNTIKVDLRLIAATNRNLEEAVAKGEFRADLYFRVSVVPIFLPPLRERKEDIPLLAGEFLHRFNVEHDTQQTFTASALSVLSNCYFPGNVRELENCVRRTATLAQGIRIVADDFACKHDECLSAVLWKKSADAPGEYVSLPIERGGRLGAPLAPPLAPRSAPAPAAPVVPPAAAAAAPEAQGATLPAEPAGEEGAADSEAPVDRARLVEAMETAGWVQARAARLLGLTPRQIGYALRKHGIEVKKF
jgi:Nif-specific regulatory protein